MSKSLLTLVPALMLGALGTQVALAAQGDQTASKAQTDSAETNPNPTRPSEIIVTGTRLHTTLRDTPAAVTVVGKDDIQLGQPQMTLDESLLGVPGLFTQDQYNQALGLRVSIRGFGARANFGVTGVKILIDGIPATTPDGSANADTVDLGATSRIEVIRGPSATQYGNASGGVINITTEPPPDQPFAEVRLSGGSFGFKKLQFKTGAQGDRVGYVINVSDRHYDGFREHSYAEKKYFTSRFNIDLGKSRLLRANLSYGNQPLAQDPGGVTLAMAENDPRAARDANVAFNAREWYKQTRLGFVYDTPLGEHGTLTARNYYSWRNYQQFLPYEAGGVPSFRRLFTGGGVTYNYDGFWLDRPNKLVTGVDIQDQIDKRKRHDNDFGDLGALAAHQREAVLDKGVFLQNQLSITRNVLLTLGVRYDQVTFDVDDHFLTDGNDSGRVTESNTSPMAALVYTLSPALNFYGKYSTAFEWPTTDEYANPTGIGGFNQNLKPQSSVNHEIGMRGTINGKHHYEMAVYAVTTDDELVPFEMPGKPGHDYFVNAGTSKRDGFEASLVSNLTDRVRTTFSYTYADYKFEHFVDANDNDFSGKFIPDAPKNQFYAGVRYQDPHGWFGAVSALYVDKQYADNANTAWNPGYTLTDFRFGYQFKTNAYDITPYVSVNNALNETYNSNLRINAFGGRYFEAGPDRNFVMGVTVKYRL